MSFTLNFVKHTKPVVATAYTVMLELDGDLARRLGEAIRDAGIVGPALRQLSSDLLNIPSPSVEGFRYVSSY